MTDEVRFQALVREFCRPFRPLSDSETLAFWQHYEMMVRWNRKLNLTRITEPAEAVRRHYGESVFLASRLQASVGTVIDLGSGAGFPGYPIAVIAPEIQVTLLESDQRKAAFLRESCGDRKNVRILCQRSVDVAGVWDCVVSRAVRAEEVTSFGLGHASHLALLMTADEGTALSSSVANKVLHPLPWDASSCLLTADVPRGT